MLSPECCKQLCKKKINFGAILLVLTAVLPTCNLYTLFLSLLLFLHLIVARLIYYKYFRFRLRFIVPGLALFLTRSLSWPVASVYCSAVLAIIASKTVNWADCVYC